MEFLFTIILVILVASFAAMLYVGIDVTSQEMKHISEEDNKTRQGLIARADAQHNAIMSGDIDKGMYGNYQPPKELR